MLGHTLLRAPAFQKPHASPDSQAGTGTSSQNSPIDPPANPRIVCFEIPMKNLHLLLVFLVSCLWPLSSAAADSGAEASAKAARRPNIIIIYTDDQGSVDVNCYGSNDIETPNMDRLAETGVRFTQMLAPSAICSASRAGLMTGRIPARAGVPGNVSSSKGHAGMPTTEITIAELLKANRYGNCRENVRPDGAAELKGPDRKLFLADLSKDVGERNNLANDHPDVVKRLKTMADKEQAGLRQE